MFKTRRTQFAIRKLAKGAAAVLLSFGILAGSSAPLVSAATSEIQSEMTTETQTEVAETAPAENETTPQQETTIAESTQGERITENTTETSQEVAQPENDSTQKTTKPEVSTTEKENTQVTTPEITPETEKVESGQTEIDDKVESNKTENTEETVDKTDNNKTENSDTDKKEKPNISQMTKEELANYIKEVADKHPLGIAGIFHIFGNEVDGQVHIAGNIAGDKVAAGDFGTNKDANSNLTTGDIHYIGSIDHFNKINGDNKVVIFGPDIEYRSYENGGAIQVNFGTTDKPDWRKVDIPFGHIVKAEQKLDIQGELDKLSDKSDTWASQTQTEGIKADFTDHNNSWIDVSEAIKNAGDSKEPIYVNIDAAHLSGGNKRNITIKGIPAGADAPVIILNVTNIQGGDLTVQTHLVLEYNDQTSANGSSEKHDQFNKLLWNFGTDLNSLTVSGDYHLGSILATNAHITTNVNVDGNIIGNKVTIKGESHRWDLVSPDFVEVEKPKPEDPKPEPNPTPDPDPTPDPNPDPNPDPDPDPTPDPDPDPNPDPDPEPTPNPELKPEEPTTPETPSDEEFVPPLAEEEPESPESSEETPTEEDFVRPLPEDVKDKITDTKKETVTPLPESVVKTTHEKVEAERVTPKATSVVTSTEKEVALPETGEKKNNLLTMGIVMTGLATAIATLGIVTKKKEN